MLLIVDGRVSVSLRLPGRSRRSRSRRMGAGEVLGEIPLLDGGRHSATARVDRAARACSSLSRADFAALVSRRHPTAFALKRRIAGVACARLRRQLAALAASLGGDAARPRPPAPAPSPTSSPAGRRTAATCGGSRPSAPSTRSRCGAS